ncbi:MAG: S-layer homology domain-containing protein [Clostridia bacterium]|nr:S-layer homology domain-containing protein [Clostridia bacterium]
MKKRLLSFILACAMLLPIVPISTLAADDTDSVIFTAEMLTKDYYSYPNDFVPRLVNDDGVKHMHHQAPAGTYGQHSIYARFTASDFAMTDYEYIALYYRTNSEVNTLDISIKSSAGENWMKTMPTQSTDGEWHKAIIRIEDINATEAMPKDGELGIDLVFKPCGGHTKNLSKTTYFDVACIGFFKKRADASALELPKGEPEPEDLTLTATGGKSVIFDAYMLKDGGYYTYANDFRPTVQEDEGGPYLQHKVTPNNYKRHSLLSRLEKSDFIMDDYPYIAIGYRTDSKVKTLDVTIHSDAGENWPVSMPEQIGDYNWHKIVVDYRDISANPNLPREDEPGVAFVIKPYGAGDKTITEWSYYDIRYIGFFEYKKDAEAYEFKFDTGPEYTDTERKEALKDVYFEATDDIIKEYTDKAQALIDTITDSETNVNVTGTKYYVSNKGNDQNDGTSPETAWGTMTKVNQFEFSHGDGVFFERGGTWRGPLKVKNGVTYSAYGEGAKPVINGATSANSATVWQETDTPNVYMYTNNMPASNDVGEIIFDNGRAWGVKVLKMPQENKRAEYGTAYNGIDYVSDDASEFTGYRDLKNDLEYYHDMTNNRVYLYSAKGNPGDRFKTIELTTNQNGIDGGNTDIVIDNLSIRAFGAHGIRVTNPKNYKVQNCILSWIGGSIQSYNKQLRPTRYGNAVEAWMNVDGFTIDHCFAYQVFDCAWTTQWEGDSKGESVIMNNINITNNVAMYANTGLEMWNTSHAQYPGAEFSVKNMRMSGNYNLYMGYGMTTDRTADKKDANLIYGTTMNCENNSVDNNVLLFSNYQIFNSQSIGKTTYNFHDNVYIVNDGILLGKILKYTGEDRGGQFNPILSSESIGNYVLTGADSGSKFYVVPSQSAYAVPEYSPANEADRFTDVPAGFWGRDYIDYVVFNEFYSGVSETEFAPNAPMTRAMVTTVLMRMANGRVKDGTLPYTDLAVGAWYEKGIKWAYQNGVIAEGDSFRPDDSVTREELADMLYKYALTKGYTPTEGELKTFADADKITPAYAEAVSFCVNSGIIGGYEDGTIRPQNGATRTEVAAMVQRFMGV